MLAAAALAATALLWGSNHVAARAIHGDVPLPALMFWRWALALAVLTPFALPGLMREWPVIRPQLWRIFVLGTAGVGLFSACLFAGAYYSLALEVGLLNATTPIWVVLMAMAAGAPSGGARQWGGILLALAGVATILLKGSLAGIGTLEFHVGNIFTLAGAIVFAWYTLALGARPLGISSLSATVVMAWSGLISILAPAYAGYLLLGGTDPLLSADRPPAASLAVAYIAFGPTLLGNLFWIYGASRLGAARAGPFLYLSPVASLVLAVTLLGEPLALFQLAGACAILCGVALSSTARPAA
ncbi:DMT family transporter [Xanthobacter sp. KR7-65]|uniref:DMT family transporter n=1 Tax=Xanthobacter sp. KR7-65 TaxID=3156612 RepID=UPI0032B3E957